MQLLEFACPSCRAPVLAPPGAQPLCPSCGRSFPIPGEVPPLPPQPPASRPRVALAGAAVLLASAAVIASMWGRIFPVLPGETDEGAAPETKRPLTMEERKELDALIIGLGHDDGQEAMKVWHQIYRFDRINAEETFQKLAASYGTTKARNALWIMTDGFCRHYGQAGEAAVVKGLVSRKSDGPLFEWICQALEANAQEAGNAERVLRILERVRPEIEGTARARFADAAARRIRLLEK